MSEEPHNENPSPEPERQPPTRPVDDSSKPAASETGTPSPAKQLTPEEQMARFEDALKEEDWGHQPC